MGGLDSYGRLHQDLACGRVPIPFPHHRVALAHKLELRMPNSLMLCTLRLMACTPDGNSVAQNFLHYFVSSSYPPDREETRHLLVLRGTPANWARAEWSGGTEEREKERAEDCCYGSGHGFFEWILPLNGANLSKARRLRVLCEAASHRTDAPQTDEDVFPTTLQMFLNNVRVYEAVLKNHPHDSRGVLSYLRGGLGAYGYPAYAVAEGDLIQQITRHNAGDFLNLRCSVPEGALVQGGLTIFGAECGRFPVCPTVLIEW
jgi:hypothetical protein